MIDYINYYYELYPNNINYINDKYYFNYNNFNYALIKYDKDINNLDNIISLNKELIKYNPYISEIIINKLNNYIFNYNNTNYILLKYFIEDRIINIYDIINITNTINKIDIDVNYNKLWEVKIDYLEYEFIHYIKKYPLINSVIDYYIGLSENAIVYYNYINKDNLVYGLAHNRIGVNTTLFELYNPLNIIIDYKIRDISMYIQDAFFNDIDMYNILNIIFNNYIFDKDNLSILISRLLFPVYFYDTFESIVTNDLNENILLDIIKKSSKYEDFINKIIKTNNLPNISWIR